MTQNETNVANLPNVNVVKILSLISIALVPTCMGSYIGIILAVVALMLGDRVQNSYMTEHPDPQSWDECPSLLKYMIYATIGFILNALMVTLSFNIGIVEIMNKGFYK